MLSQLGLSLQVIFLLSLAVGALSTGDKKYKYSRADFPPDFIFGAATSAFQVEGAANEDGRTPTIWDTYVHAGYEKGANADVTCDEYHKYKDDVRLMVETGLDAYRFSVSWPRLIPNGQGPVNPKGLEYYNNLINELIRNGIQPHVTLHHHDLPQALDDEYGGWVSSKIISDFTNYADVCFREFGDRVSHWITINEPNLFAVAGYDMGIMQPLRCSPPFGAVNCTRGNSTIEPYLAVHHMLLAHASAVRLYRERYKEQNGFIGLVVWTTGFIPQTNTKEDKAAAERSFIFLVGWILEPLVHGDYPRIMKINAGSRLPAFTDSESQLVKGSFDFIGSIYYYNMYIKDNSDSLKLKERDFMADSGTVMIGYWTHPDETIEYPVTPLHLQGMLENLKQLYGNPPIYIYENGQRTKQVSSLQDVTRVRYLHGCIGGVLDAVRSGSNIRGYFVWSLLDLFEIPGGYDMSFGLYYVDFDDLDLKRYPKLSQQWYSGFLRGSNMSAAGTIELEKNSSSFSIDHLFQ